jgi:hypothetical protein
VAKEQNTQERKRTRKRFAFTRRKIFAFFKDHYSYDDFQYGQVPYVGVPFQPNHLRCIIEERWKVS